MESSGSLSFNAFRDLVKEREGSAPWEFVPTAEAESFAVVAPDRCRVFFIAGQQVRTRDGLEVLALGCDRQISGGMTLAQAIDSIHEHLALPIVAWGFGKWRLRRYARVRDLLMSSNPTRIFIGDSAGRLAWAPRSRLFSLASAQGILNLPGTDPLPVPSQVRKPGRCGFVIEGRFDFQRPAASLTTLLRDTVKQPLTYGRHDSVVTILRGQAGMHIGRRRSVEWRR
jgi:hypothetical protein